MRYVADFLQRAILAPKDELIELKRCRLASMSETEQRNMLTQSAERALKPHYDEFVRKSTERYK